MRVVDEDTWELNTPKGVATYWDDILNEFGPEGYVEMRYVSQLPRLEAMAARNIAQDPNHYAKLWKEVPEWTPEVGVDQATLEHVA